MAENGTASITSSDLNVDFVFMYSRMKISPRVIGIDHLQPLPDADHVLVLTAPLEHVPGRQAKLDRTTFFASST